MPALELEFWVLDFAGGFGAVDGEGGVCEEADLLEDGGLVPVDVLVGELVAAETDDGYERDLDAAVGGGMPGSIQGISWV